MPASIQIPPEAIDANVADEVERCVRQWEDREGNLIMILHEIQDAHGYVPRETSLVLSRRTGVPMARIYEVITFYHYFKLVPPGKHNLSVCNGTACYLKGAGRNIAELEKKLQIKDGETTEDRLFHFETVRCIGCCGMAPAMTVDKKVIGRIGSTQVDEIVDAIREEEGEA